MKHTLPPSGLPVLSTILMLGVALGGCGQRGPLVLPVKPPAPITATALPASAASPASLPAPTIKSSAPATDTAPQ